MLILMVPSLCVATNTFSYNYGELVILNEVRKGALEACYQMLEEPIPTDRIDVLKLKDKSYDEEADTPVYVYAAYINKYRIADFVVFAINGEVFASTVTFIRPLEENIVITENDILCSYSLTTHTIVGEENKTREVIGDLTNVKTNGIEPLVQVDKNGIGRDWCFLSAMGMIINFTEGSSYDTKDIANMYLNGYEVNRRQLNDKGYVSNSSGYDGNRRNTIVDCLEYRGTNRVDQKVFTAPRAREWVDKGYTTMTFCYRYNREVINGKEIEDGIIGGDIVEPNGFDEHYGPAIGSHVVVLYGYDTVTGEVYVADPSPLEQPPGPYTPTIEKLVCQNNKVYLPVRKSTKLENTVHDYKVYIMDLNLVYKGNKYLDYLNAINSLYVTDRDEINEFDDPRYAIMLQESKQFSSFACLASIYNVNEKTSKSVKDVAYDLLPAAVVQYILRTDENIFTQATGKPIDRYYIANILKLRGYTVSGNLGYKSVRLETIQESMRMGCTIGIEFDIVDTNGLIVNTHYTLVDAVYPELNKIKIMDPSVGYKMISKSDTSLDGSYYGVGYKLIPNGFYRYSFNYVN